MISQTLASILVLYIVKMILYPTACKQLASGLIPVVRTNEIKSNRQNSGSKG